MEDIIMKKLNKKILSRLDDVIMSTIEGDKQQPGLQYRSGNMCYTRRK